MMMKKMTTAGAMALALVACGGSGNGESAPEPATEATGSSTTTEETAPAVGGIPERGDDAERASKNGETVATMGGLTVTVRYGRPNVNGRTIFGGLVPFDSVWRTGANEATTITFSAPATFGETAVDAGTYALFSIPGESEWTLILNRDAEQWGASRYDESRDAARVTVTPAAHAATEEMTFADDGGLFLRWAETSVPVPVAAQ
ncbi:MAG: DUF2911 domain-containing protein [Myxococcota bacterium]